jgi:phosphoenolpyruvate carboxykinase (ATP)
MSVPTISINIEKLAALGLKNSESIHYQLTPDELVQDTLKRGEGLLNDTGALVITTGEFTGRSPKDRFIIKDEITADTVNWNDFNNPLEPKYFDIIYKKVMSYLNALPELWIRDSFVCADPRYRLNLRVITENPWCNLFAYNMFLRPSEEELDSFSPEWHVISAPGLRLDPHECGIRQHNAALISFKHKMIIVTGSGYTGEIKKGVFSVLNYLLPKKKKVLSMHCSANMGDDGSTAIFFGLSGTGKTTLSADPSRKLIGDDEHAWTDDNIFNFEGGCYAKCINLTEEKEPEIYNAIRPGALVENVVFFPATNKIDFEAATITENTRVSYPLFYISNSLETSVGNPPKNIFLLTCDAFGVLPPISKLSPGQAMYQFISGYTAKVAGTETDITEPKPTFSACFGAPFMPLHPGFYAEMFGERMQQHNVDVWLINTGWTGGPFGTGTRIKLSYTRAMITAALNDELKNATFEKDPVFGVGIPASCPGVPAEVLQPRNTWQDKDAYDEKAKFLAGLFIKNFEKYKDVVNHEILNASPKA